MQVTITFDAANPADVLDAKKTLEAFAFAQQSGNAPAASTKATTTKEKPADKPKAETPAPVVETPKAAEPDPLDDAPKAVVVDRETVRASLKKVQTLDGKDAAVAILKKYGANSMSELKEESFAGAYADAEANPKVKAAG